MLGGTGGKMLRLMSLGYHFSLTTKNIAKRPKTCYTRPSTSRQMSASCSRRATDAQRALADMFTIRLGCVTGWIGASAMLKRSTKVPHESFKCVLEPSKNSLRKYERSEMG